MMETLWQDLRYGLHMLRKNPGFTAAAVLTLALGVGATTAIFSVVYGVLLRPLPYKNPQQIVRLWEQNATGHRMNFADPNFEDVRAQNHSLLGVAQFYADLETVTGHGEASRRGVAIVSRDFFQVMGVKPIVGRGFAPEEQRPNAGVAALVSYAYWTQTLGSVRDLSSIHLKISDQAASVVGVLPPGFRFPNSSDIWIPHERIEFNPSRNGHNAAVVARLREGSSVTAARTELSGIAQRLKQLYGEDTDMVAVAVAPLREAMTSEVRPALLILLGASAFLLLITCANVTNLLLAQATGRERELSIRAALGAPRGRLIRQFLTESFLLSLVGGAAGIFLASWGLRALVALAPPDLPRLDEISLNSVVLLFSLGVISLVSMAMAAFTGVRALSRDSGEGLKEGSRGGTGTVSKQRMGRMLAAAQLATALVLLLGASLMARSLLRVLSVNCGFRTENVVTMELGLPNDKAERVALLNQLFTRLDQIPGIDQVGGTNDLPLSGSGFADGSFAPMNASQISPRIQDLIRQSVAGNLEKDPALLSDLVTFFNDLFRDKSQLGYADFIIASSGYFPTLNIPLLQGRLFDERDTFNAPHAALISQSLANKVWPGQNPLGRTIEFGNMDGDLRLLTVVGVVGDVRDHSAETAPAPTVYVDYRQRPQMAWDFTIVMHTTGNSDSVFSAARAVLRDLNPDIPPRFSTLSHVYAASLETRRFTLTLAGVFSFAALLLALAGIYGVISYSVSQRTREIGVRMALGATAQEVLMMVLRQGAITGAIGIFVGLLGSFAATRWLQSQLFGVSPTDPVTFVGVALLLILVSLVACWIPGRRAMRIDPMVALRYE